MNAARRSLVEEAQRRASKARAQPAPVQLAFQGAGPDLRRYRKELRANLCPLMDRMVHCTAMLTLHMTGHLAQPMSEAEVRHHLKVLRYFKEAIDAAL